MELRISDYYYEYLQFNPTLLTVWAILEAPQDS